MNDTLKLGRIAGIPIGLNWTWLFVFGLFVWSLASAVFPSTNPGLATETYVEMAVVAVFLFFGSLLLHELGHAVQARRDGVKIDGITLWLFGGVARFRGMFPNAGAEFRIAIAGPLVTAVLAAAFVALAALTRFHPAVDAVFAWLGYINLFLLAFNLLPALPLDGGRVFRAALWQLRGNYASATRIAAGFGRVIGGLMIAAGVLALFTQGAFAGAWLALIGWFVLVSAGGEARLGVVRNALDGLVVGDLMRVHPIAAQAGQTLRDFTAELSSDDHSPAYPVLDGLRPVGILPSSRISQTPSDAWATARVRHEMLPLSEVPALKPNEPAFDGMLALVGTGADGVLVLENGRLAGILYTRDVADALDAETRPWARRLRRSDSRSPAVQVGPRPVTVPGHATGPPRDAA